MIDFYGVFPEKEPFPSIRENGLLYGFLSRVTSQGSPISPIVGSFRDGSEPSCRFSFGNDISLIYASRGFNGFYSGFGDIYFEGLSAVSNLLQKELESRIGRLDVLKKKFNASVEENTSRVADSKRVNGIKKLLAE